MLKRKDIFQYRLQLKERFHIKLLNPVKTAIDMEPPAQQCSARTPENQWQRTQSPRRAYSSDQGAINPAPAMFHYELENGMTYMPSVRLEEGIISKLYWYVYQPTRSL